MSPYELLKSLQRQFAFSETDQKRLTEMGLWLVPQSGGLVKTFYAPLEKFPANKMLLDAVPGRRTKLRLVVGEWYTGIFNGPWDAHYAQRRWNVGVLHRQVDIPLVLMVSAIENAYRFSAHQLSESAGWLKYPLTDYVVSLTKMLNIDLALLGQSYAAGAAWPNGGSADARTCQGLMAYESSDLLETLAEA